MLGLKRGTVELVPHQTVWEEDAAKTILLLKSILNDAAIDIQHVGSTAIKNICAKPIIDIAVGVDHFADLDNYLESLLNIGVYKSSGQPFEDIILFSKDDDNGNRLNNIQIVIYGEEQWNKHILFRDYMNSNPEKASEYERIKIEAAELFPNDVSSYSNYKSSFIAECIEETKKRKWYDY